MKASIVYACGTYGNGGNAAEYSVKLSRGGRRISLTFEFKDPAEGRGVGPARGEVKRVTLEMPCETAHALSHAFALIDTASQAVEFSMSEGCDGRDGEIGRLNA